MKINRHFLHIGIFVILGFNICYNNTLLKVSDGIGYKQLSKLKQGVSKSDLIRLMGQPVSQNMITKGGKEFNAFYYNYTEKLNPGKRKNEKAALSGYKGNFKNSSNQHKLTIIMQNERILNWIIDPGESAIVAIAGKQKNTTTVKIIGVVFLGLFGAFFALR